jgi:hypothetical protein
VDVVERKKEDATSSLLTLNSSKNHVISVMWHGHVILWKSCGQYFKSFQKGKFMRLAALLVEKNAKY